MLHSMKEFTLDDGRVVACPSPAEARFLWSEITAVSGFYRRAAARLRPGDVVLDIGANIGLSSMMFAAACPGARVIAAEPAPVTFRCLESNLAAFVPSAVPLCTAVGAAPGVLPFTWYPRAPANSGFYADRAEDDAATRAYLRNSGLDDTSITLITADLHRGQQIDVDITTVPAILAEHAPEAAVGALKIDVERAELDVLRGITEDCWPRIRAVVAEVHDTDDRLAAVEKLLSEHGFSTEIRQDPNMRGTTIHEVFAERSA